MKKAKLVFLTILAFLFFTIVIPIAINEAYKHDAVYVTMWTASDVLSYYGTLLGAGATIVALVFTIVFTQKQIQRDRFLECNRGKWEKAESIITQTLADISPLKMCNFDKLDGTLTENLQTLILNLQSYAVVAKTSLNNIKCYISPCDYQQIALYITELYNSIMLFCEVDEQLISKYMELRDIALSNNGSIPESELTSYLDIISEINKKIAPMHDGPYQQLLNRKREVFDKIYSDIERQANQILQFREKEV